MWRSGVVGQAGAALTTSADSFVENAAIADMYETEAARIAQERSTSPAVRQLAEQIIQDHAITTKGLREAVSRSPKLGLDAIPAKLDTRRTKMIQHLREAPADKFDMTYIDQQVLAHEEAVTLAQHYRDKGDDPELRAHAAAASPLFEKHLQEAKRIKPS